MVLKCYKMMIFCFYFFGLVFRFELRFCGLRCGVEVCDMALRFAFTVLRLRCCSLRVAVELRFRFAVCGCGCGCGWNSTQHSGVWSIQTTHFLV